AVSYRFVPRARLRWLARKRREHTTARDPAATARGDPSVVFLGRRSFSASTRRRSRRWTAPPQSRGIRGATRRQREASPTHQDRGLPVLPATGELFARSQRRTEVRHPRRLLHGGLARRMPPDAPRH